VAWMPGVVCMVPPRAGCLTSGVTSKLRTVPQRGNTRAAAPPRPIVGRRPAGIFPRQGVNRGPLEIQRG